MGKIKVCHLISGDLWAGAEVMANNLLKGLQSFPDLELSAIFLNEGLSAGAARKRGIPVWIVPEADKSFIDILRRVVGILRRESPAILHPHRYKENILAYLASRMVSGVRLISTQHGMPEMPPNSVGLKCWLTSRLNFYLLARKFWRIVAVSEDVRWGLIRQHGLPEEKVAVIYNGIELPPLTSSSRNGGEFLIGSMGRCFPVKDYPLMVEVAREILAINDRARFELVGEGPEQDKIEGLIREYRLDSVFRLPGFIRDVNSFCRRLALYLNTSVHEGIPMSVLEAMANQVPVVAPKVGGFKEIVEDGKQGFLVEGRDPRAFADRCLYLLEHPTALEQMGRAARERVEQKFSENKMVQHYHRLYRQAVGQDSGEA